MGLDHFSKVYDVENKELKLQLWDTGGEYFEFVYYKIISVLDVVQFQEKFAFCKTSFATQHSFATPNCTLEGGFPLNQKYITF